MPRILIVDDEQGIRRSLAGLLSDEGYETALASDGEAGLAAVREQAPDLVLLDIAMPGRDGIEVLEEMRQAWPRLPVIMMSGHGTIETAVRATRLGAYDFLEKPPDMERTLLAVRHAIDQRRLEEENRQHRQRLEPDNEIVGASPIIRRLQDQIAAAAPTNGRVLIRGESGTGKECCWPARSTAKAFAARVPSWPSTARPSPRS